MSATNFIADELFNCMATSRNLRSFEDAVLRGALRNVQNLSMKSSCLDSYVNDTGINAFECVSKMGCLRVLDLSSSTIDYYGIATMCKALMVRPGRDRPFPRLQKLVMNNIDWTGAVPLGVPHDEDPVLQFLELCDNLCIKVEVSLMKDADA